MDETTPFCQSCGMPLDDAAIRGTLSDGATTDEYCRYCYQNGTFTEDITMDDMVRVCVPHLVEAHPDMTAEQAEAMMRKYLPSLKRWQTK